MSEPTLVLIQHFGIEGIGVRCPHCKSNIIVNHLHSTEPFTCFCGKNLIIHFYDYDWPSERERESRFK